MWKHKIIADIENEKLQKDIGIDHQDVDTFNKQVIEYFKNSIGFYVGDFLEEKILFDMSYKNKENDGSFITANQLYAHNRPFDDYYILFNIRCVKMCAYLSYDNKDKQTYIYMFKNVDGHGWFLITGNCIIGTDGFLRDFISDKIKYGYGVSMQFCIAISAIKIFNRLLNCKNVSTEEIHPPEKLNKKRLKNGKLPLYSYHVLNVDLGKENHTSLNDSDGNGIKHRVHFQRGHFKQYTEQNKLFGKHTGLYWWQPHLRGQNKDGFVDKEYNIKV